MSGTTSDWVTIALRKIRWLLVVLLLTSCAVREVNGPTTVDRVFDGPDRQEYYVVVTCREGVTQKAFVMKPPFPVATVILFTGGNGRANVSQAGVFGQNFLIRNQWAFFEENLMVGIVDVPSDRSTLDFFRHSNAHAIDIKGIILEIRKLVDVPVWAVGTSNGSASVVNVAARFPPPIGPDGIVLTSSVERSGKGNSVFDAALGRIKVPALVVHHKNDACRSTPYHGAIRLKASLSGSRARELIGIDGGNPSPHSDPCQPFHYHGFVGRERDVVRIIADWIKAHPPK